MLLLFPHHNHGQVIFKITLYVPVCIYAMSIIRIKWKRFNRLASNFWPQMHDDRPQFERNYIGGKTRQISNRRALPKFASKISYDLLTSSATSVCSCKFSDSTRPDPRVGLSTAQFCFISVHITSNPGVYNSIRILFAQY